jgi:hypothetical protein
MESVGEFENTCAFGSGTHPEANASGPADPTLPPPPASAGQADAEAPPDLDMTDVVTGFVASPLLPEPALLRMDNIAAFLALAVDAPFI